MSAPKQDKQAEREQADDSPGPASKFYSLHPMSLEDALKRGLPKPKEKGKGKSKQRKPKAQ